MKKPSKALRLQCPCEGEHFQCVFRYTAPIEGEIAFQALKKQDYYRELHRCELCGHFVSLHEMELDDLYEDDYMSANYQDLEGIRSTFDRINALPPEKSDNVGRVSRIHDYASSYFGEDWRERTVLDVGSGLGVFAFRMKERGWNCTVLDPDQRSCQHAKEHIGVQAFCGDFLKAESLGRFDFITFNKVLEHVEDPVSMLKKAREHLTPSGIVYVELPDGECAVRDGDQREEFAIDHLHVFSMASLSLLAERAGFDLLASERLQEPSTKYTLRAFLRESLHS